MAELDAEVLKEALLAEEAETDPVQTICKTYSDFKENVETQVDGEGRIIGEVGRIPDAAGASGGQRFEVETKHVGKA